MSDLIQLVQDADFALLDVEQTRVAIEAAKAALEMAKSDHDRAKAAFDEVIARADGLGVSRAKLRKIIEERAAVLSASGLLSVPVNKMGAQKPVAKAPKKSAKPKEKKDETYLGTEADASQEMHLDA